jgi:hypothetical protein
LRRIVSGRGGPKNFLSPGILLCVPEVPMKLVQKHLFKATQEFELLDNEIRVRIKTPFKEKRLTVPFEILNPEPVVNNSRLEFHSRVKCGPLLSLYLNRPNPREFNAFVSAVKEKALQEFNAFAGIK